MQAHGAAAKPKSVVSWELSEVDGGRQWLVRSDATDASRKMRTEH